MTTSNSKPKLTADDLRELIKANPDLLKEFRSNQVAKQGVPAFELLGTEERTYIPKRMEGTKMVDDEPVVTTVYHIRNLNGEEVFLPKHCLADYGINESCVSKFIDDDGLSASEKNAAITLGAF